MDSNRYIASKIGLAREISGMSIATLARRAGMTPPNALSESLRVLNIGLSHTNMSVFVESPHGPPRRREAARFARTSVRASQGRGVSPARERIACARTRAPVARYPGGAALH